MDIAKICDYSNSCQFRDSYSIFKVSPPIDTFVYDYQPPDLYDYNNVAGSDRDYSVDTNQNIIYPWNNMDFAVTADNSRVSFAVDQFTYLSNQWVKDSDGTIVDAVLRQGKTTFQPFDSSLGTLNSVQVQYEWYLGSVLALSLYDDGFFHDAEGEAAGESKLGWAFGNVDSVADYEQVLYNYTRIEPQISLDGFAGSILNYLNVSSDAGGGAPSIFDAAACFLDPESCSQEIDWVSFAGVHFAKAYDSVQGTVILTPEEYLACMNEDQEFQIAFRKWEGHSFSYEAWDVLDESIYTSFLRGNVGIIYDYTPNTNPVPEPATLILLGTGLIGLAGLRKRCKK